MFFAQKCILGHSILRRMLSGKPVKIYLLIGIYWKYLNELKKWNLKRNLKKGKGQGPTKQTWGN
jgi:hypothetical protein